MRYIRRLRHDPHKYQRLDGAHQIETVDSIDLERSSYSNHANKTFSSLTHPTSIATTTSSFNNYPHLKKKRPSFRQICIPNVFLTLVTHFLLAFHASAFNALCFVFLPTPRAPEGSQTGFFHFGGGLGMSSSRVGLATAIIGFIGLPLQIFVYPRVQFRLGTLKSFRTFLPFSPVAYFFVPFLVLVPRLPYLVWPALAALVFLQVLSRTFSLPAIIILVNNCAPDPSVLSTVHGVAQSVASAARTLGPLIGGWGLGLGLQHNIVGAIWWALAVEALLCWFLTFTIREGNGG